MASSLLQRLKQETHASHVELERRVDVMSRVQTVASYRALLEAYFGLCCPLEIEIKRSIRQIEFWLPDVQSRLRTSSLRRDLQILGNDCPETLPLAPIPPLGSLSEQLGCLYVLEGSTLGGQIIAREIHCRLHFTPDRGCSYLASYGVELGNMWMRFRAAIEAYAIAHPDPIYQDSVIQSAVATFRAFADGMEGTYEHI
jgi:heme oxygenase (biliverdin-IX-beta and delta-forming)